jgi:hypothetical protein
MRLAEAASEYERTKREIAKLETVKDEAASVLKIYFKRTGRSRYKNIVYSCSFQRRLDTEKVKAFLGRRLPRFQKTTPIEQLSLLS